jgi:two-component system sensor histidine kinase KdpD
VSRGHLRIYLGAAPGVGKTFAMLSEGRRRAARGTDVVIGVVETHGRANTEEQIGDLETVPRRSVDYRGTTFEEMDLDAVLARRPAVALVDELAHTNAPGGLHEKRWEDVHALLDAGIDVISTVNIQHLESLNDVVETITGIHQRETVPDRVVREADQVELVDMTPEALRRRMAHGNIYDAGKVDTALTNYFRPGNLSALRELALLWVADKVDDALQGYMDDHGITGTWETRERVVVAVTGAPSGEHLIRRAARMAQRTHADLIGVHVKAGEGLASGVSQALLDGQQLLCDLGGTYHEVVADDVADGLAAFARSVKATQLVLGSTRRRRTTELVRGSVINKAIRLSGDIDVHVISYEGDEARRLPQAPRRRSPLNRRRQVVGWGVALIGLPLLTAGLAVVRDTVGLPTVLLLYLLLVTIVAAIGGLRPALAVALLASATTNWFFTQPYGTFVIDDADQIVAIVVFIASGALVSVLVGQSARHSAEAQRARAEAEVLAVAAARLSADQDPLAAMLAHLRITFGQDAIALFARTSEGEWERAAVDGADPPDTVDAGERIEIGQGMTLVIVPGRLSGEDRRLLDAFTNRLADALERRDLERLAREASVRGRADELRTAILRAVSHDLRSPLASIKASATSLLQDDVEWTGAERKEFARTIDEEADRLDRLVANLLDMSRIEAGVVQFTSRPVGLEEVIAAALDSLSGPTANVVVEIGADLPTAFADAGLLERVVANLVANAVEHAPPTSPVRVQAAAHGGRAIVRIADQGPGIDADHRERMFDPFQRLGDSSPTGVGLGLAVARGFTQAMGGELTVEDTPGGGLTVVLTLPLVEPAEGRPPAGVPR